MPDLAPTPWLPWLLFRLTVALAGILLLGVVAAPWLDGAAAPAHGWSLVLAMFAHDPVVRRTVVGGVVGLLVTAFVFFRPSGAKSRSSRPPRPPRNIAGA